MVILGESAPRVKRAADKAGVTYLDAKDVLMRRLKISANSEKKIFQPPKWKKKENVCARR